MTGNLLLGVDIGTQGAKGILCDLSGRVIASGYREQSIRSPQPGWAEHDAEGDWWNAFVSLSREMLTESGVDPARIAAIGISAFVPAMLALDAQGTPLRPAILYLDRRSEEELDQLTTSMRDAGYPEEEVTTFGLASPILQLLWVKKHEPALYRKIAKITQCQSYVIYRLTGKHVVDHAMKYSYAPLYEVALDQWSEVRAQDVDLNVDILPDQILWATEVAGYVTPQAAEQTGMVEGTPVSAGTADAFAEMVGSGVVKPGAATALYGSMTAILIGQEKTNNPYHGYHCLPDLYFSGAAVHTGASLTKWFRDVLGERELAIELETGQNAYHLLEQLAIDIEPGCDGLIALPFFSGEKSQISPDLNQGAFIGLTTLHTRGHIYRALLEGIAYELRYQLVTEDEIPKEMNAIGGGSRNHLWTQIISDVLQTTQYVLDNPFGAALGDAYLAGMAVGLFDDIDPLLRDWIRIQRTVKPQLQRKAAYHEIYEIYLRVREQVV
jgi:xylulokinase